MADGVTATGRQAERRPGSAPRSRGRLSVSVSAQPGGATCLTGLHQAGCLRYLFPTPGDDALTAIALNTGGGLTGGDRLETRAGALTGHLVISTQAAERAYRATPGSHATVSNRIGIGAGARVDWVPQETILFDNSALERSLDVEMDADATFLMAEPLILGRQAMGEVVTAAHLRDRIRVRRGGDLVFADALRLGGDIARRVAGNATMGGAVALASVLMVCRRAEASLAPARALMPGAGPVTGGVSLIAPGVLFARLVAHDGFDLRRVLIPLLHCLGGRDLPRTWSL